MNPFLELIEIATSVSETEKAFHLFPADEINEGLLKILDSPTLQSKIPLLLEAIPPETLIEQYKLSPQFFQKFSQTEELKKKLSDIGIAILKMINQSSQWIEKISQKPIQTNDLASPEIQDLFLQEHERILQIKEKIDTLLPLVWQTESELIVSVYSELKEMAMHLLIFLKRGTS